MTAVEEGRGPAPGLAVDDSWVPFHLALDRAAPTLHAPTTWQVKADARMAAKALHDAMSSAPATVLEEPWEPVRDEPVAAIATEEDVGPDVAGGVRWSLIATIGTMAGRMTFVVLLMRLLGPENFGIVAQATVYVTVATIFLALGLPVTVIQRPHLDRAGVGTALSFTIASALVVGVATVLGAPLIADFFQTEELTGVLRLLSISLVLKALAIVPTAMLARKMRFRALGLAEILSTAISGGIAIAAALNGANYWALVIQILVLDTIYLALVLAAARLPAPTWSRTAAQDLWSFSSRMMGSDIINYLSNNGDKILIARLLGATPLALYALAGRVLVVPIETLSKTADRVILPMFSRLQDDAHRVARYFLEATESVALFISAPMALVILCAPLGVPMAFGDAWDGAILPLQLLAAHAIFFLLIALTNPVVQAAGRADWEFRWSVFTTVIALTTFALGLQWGIAGMAACFLVQGALLNPIRFAMIQRLIPVTVPAYLRQLAPAATSTAALVGAWIVVATTLRDQVGDLGVLVVASLAGLLAFLVSLGVLWWADLRRQLAFVRQVVRPRSP
jgi:O-antigen/teichoic acid export membrane protein